jgi:hypothetical protein
MFPHTGMYFEKNWGTRSLSPGSLSYAFSSDQYNYTWKTEKTWANTCRQFVLRLRDSERVTDRIVPYCWP